MTISLDLQDIKAIEESNYLYGLAYDTEEQSWQTTSVKIDDEGWHCHTEAKRLQTAISLMEKEVADYIEGGNIKSDIE